MGRLEYRSTASRMAWVQAAEISAKRGPQSAVVPLQCRVEPREPVVIPPVGQQTPVTACRAGSVHLTSAPAGRAGGRRRSGRRSWGARS